MTIDDEALALLREQITADLAKTAELKRQNDLAEIAVRQVQQDAQARQEADRRREIAARNRLNIMVRTNEMVEGLLALRPEVTLFVEGLVEWQKEDSRWKERVEEILLLILTGKGNGNRARIAELKIELEVDHTQRLIIQEQENLNELELQRTQYGLDVPLKLINDIKRAERELIRLQKKMDELQ